MAFNPMDLSGCTILVTGASSGIGRETAILTSRLGARLLLVARNQERLTRTLEQLEGTGHHMQVIDLAQTGQLLGWLKEMAREIGPLHGLVHSAGVHSTRAIRFLTEEALSEVMTVNVGAAVALVRAFRQKGVWATNSSVVLISSVMGLVGQPGVAAYCASKGAIVALTKSLALELASDGIRVNCVAPGQVKTEMTDRQWEGLSTDQKAVIAAMHPLGIGTALDVANAIAFLLADTSRWITGSTLVVDGGYTAR